jgi:rubredoxin
MEIDLTDWACGSCGRVYNPWIGDRFWRNVDVAGETFDLICDDCRAERDPSHARDVGAAVSST